MVIIIAILPVKKQNTGIFGANPLLCLQLSFKPLENIMKKVICVLSVVLSSSIYSHACTQVEAQFIGTVKKVTKTQAACSVQVQFSSYDSSAVCPLEIEEVLDQDVLTSRCDLNVGDAVSGILVNNGQKTYIE
jgi:hypothetical protein